MEKFNFYFSMICSMIFSIFFGVVFDWGLPAVYLCVAVSWLFFYSAGQSQIQEDENKELINKALKHYAETKGIK